MQFPEEPEVVREMAEMQTDTVDLVEERHSEMSTQTIVKSYCDAGVQVDEPVVVPVGALVSPLCLLSLEIPVLMQICTLQSPLPESTDLVDVLPADLRPISPSNTTNASDFELASPTAIESSRPSTPNSNTRIPRLASRRGSIASFRSTSTRSPSPALTRGESSPPPGPVMQKVVRQAASIRSLALRRASSAASKAPVPQAVTPTPAAPAEKKNASGRLFDAVKRIGRTDSTVRAWKP